MNSGLSILGTFKLSVKRKDGSQYTQTHKNMIVTWGLVNLAKVIAGTAFPSVLSYVALGNSSSAPALGNTTLGSELRRDQVTVSQLPAPEDNKVQFQKAFAQGAVVGTFKEAGIFDAASNGNMFNRVVFPDFVVGSADTLTLTWLIEIRNQ
jgi:hypothetical protein